MNNKPKKLETLFLRIGALIGHAIINTVIIAYATSYDLTGNWIVFSVFLLFLLVLLFLFIRHILSFINYIKQ